MRDGAQLAQSLGRIAGAKVLVVGDIMLDRYVYGEAERISPEAPVAVLLIGRQSEMLGGAGNVTRNIAALGASPLCIGLVGGDAAGDAVARLLAEIAPDSILVADPARPTTQKTRFVAGAQQMMRADQERAEPVSGAIELKIVAAIAAAAAPDAIVLSDYGKGVLTDAVIAASLEAARRRGIPVLVDPRGRDFSVYRGAAIVTPNRKELHEAASLPTSSDAEIERAARHIQVRCGIAAVLATRGAQGMTLLLPDGAIHHIAAEAREVFDVSGAGDTVIAAAAAGLAGGVPLLDAVRIANAAAGIVVGKAGTAVAHPEEIAAALNAEDGRATGGKMLGRARAAERIAIWRHQKRRIGFTNGCFDLLHPGHLHLLAQARAACDRLVVGLNSDSSARRLKGAGRPVQDEATRAAMLAALPEVDLVTVFDEDTPAALIETLHPDALIKGGDYAPHEVVGAEFVRAYGGQVVIVALLPGHSTSATVEKLAR